MHVIPHSKRVQNTHTHTHTQILHIHMRTFLFQFEEAGSLAMTGGSAILPCYSKEVAQYPDSTGTHLMHSGDKCRFFPGHLSQRLPLHLPRPPRYTYL